MNKATPPRISDLGLELIKYFEGCELESYICSSGVLTVGYGHTGSDVHKGQKISEEEAEFLLKKDVSAFQKAIHHYILRPLNQPQFDALVSWAFNVGATAVKDSTCRKRLNSKEDVNTVIAQELPRWNKGASGKPLPGLIARRQAEVKLACTGEFP